MANIRGFANALSGARLGDASADLESNRLRMQLEQMNLDREQGRSRDMQNNLAAIGQMTAQLANSGVSIAGKINDADQFNKELAIKNDQLTMQKDAAARQAEIEKLNIADKLSGGIAGLLTPDMIDEPVVAAPVVSDHNSANASFSGDPLARLASLRATPTYKPRTPAPLLSAAADDVVDASVKLSGTNSVDAAARLSSIIDAHAHTVAKEAGISFGSARSLVETKAAERMDFLRTQKSALARDAAQTNSIRGETEMLLPARVRSMDAETGMVPAKIANIKADTASKQATADYTRDDRARLQQAAIDQRRDAAADRLAAAGDKEIKLYMDAFKAFQSAATEQSQTITELRGQLAYTADKGQKVAINQQIDQLERKKADNLLLASQYGERINAKIDASPMNTVGPVRSVLGVTAPTMSTSEDDVTYAARRLKEGADRPTIEQELRTRTK